jgi:hypothetical protein
LKCFSSGALRLRMVCCLSGWKRREYVSRDSSSAVKFGTS